MVKVSSWFASVHGICTIIKQGDFSVVRSAGCVYEWDIWIIYSTNSFKNTATFRKWHNQSLSTVQDLPCIIRTLTVAAIQLLNCISWPSNSLFTVNRSSSCHRQNYGHIMVLKSNTWCMRARQDILASRFTTFLIYWE